MNLTSDIQALNEMLRITTRQVETITEKDTMNNVLVRGMRTTVTTGPRGGTTIGLVHPAQTLKTTIRAPFQLLIPQDMQTAPSTGLAPYIQTAGTILTPLHTLT
ncbi:unnamed protein product [Alternaria alternata]